jgi:hypothetical protein
MNEIYDFFLKKQMKMIEIKKKKKRIGAIYLFFLVCFGIEQDCDQRDEG